MTTLFRLLLLIYPREFRARYGDEMWVHYRTRLERARGRGRLARLRVWWATTFDVLASAVAERSSTWAAPEGVEGETMMGAAWEVFSGAVRRLVRAPGFTLVAVTIAGLGIAVNVTVFTVVDAFLFRPPPWDQPDRVVRIYQDSDDGDPSSTSFPAYRDMAATEGVFEAVGAATPATVTWDAAAGPQPLAAEFITASYLRVLGLQPALGRWFDPAYDHVGAGYYAVLGYNAWQSAFGGDPDVVGTTLRLNGSPVTVIGVAPQAFTSTMEPMVTDVFLSISSVEVGGSYRVPNLDAREDHWYQVQARLAPDVSVEQARSAMDALATRLGEDYPEVNRGRQISVFTYKQVRLHPDVDGGLYPAAGLLMVLVGLVLALACSNLANLLLARGMAREGEVAVRRAMGASRSRVTWLFLTEALLVATLSGVLGVALAGQALRLVPLIPLPLPASGDLSLPMDGRVILFALGLVLFTGLLVGLAPALRSGRSDVAGSLRKDSRSATAGRRSRRFRSLLVGVQVGASVVLLVVSGLVLRSFLNQNRADPGVAVEGVAYLGTDLSAGNRSVPERLVLLRQIEQRLAAAPGIEAVGAATRLPVTSSGGSTTTVVEGYTPPSGTDAVELMFNIVDPGYFEALGIPLVAGRYFNADDGPDQATVVILSKAAADRFWPGQDPIGRRVRGQGSENWREVVGVVDDVKVRSLGEPPTSLMYFSMTQVPPSALTFVARGRGDAGSVAQVMRNTLREVEPSLSVDALGTMAERMGASLAGPRLAALFLGALALGSVFLAALGIYAVVTFAVRRRMQEMGIRVALGATGGRLMGLVMREILGAVVLGLGVGLVLAVPLGRFLRGNLYRVGGVDPAAFGGSALVFAAVAAAAAWMSARGATRADPIRALRAER